MKAIAATLERARTAYGTLAKHRYTTVAGTLVFFLILSLVPFLFWLTLLFGSSALDAASLSGLGLFDWAEDLLVLLKENAAENAAGASIIFLATTLWSSTGFFYHLRRSGEIIYGCERTKHGWKVRLAALFYTLGILLFFAAAGAILFVAGVASRFLPPWLSYPVWYLLALLLGFFAAWILNTYLCPYKCKPSDTALGSFLTAIAWLIASGAFAVYLNFGNKEQLYGALTLVVVFLIWLYWMMICLTAGAVFCHERMGEQREHKQL